jgi:hypothetical protein
MMKIIYAILMLIMGAVMVVTSNFGPKKWWIVSSISALLFGLFSGLLFKPNMDGILTGLLGGFILLIWTLISNFSGKYHRDEAYKRLKNIFKRIE